MVHYRCDWEKILYKSKGRNPLLPISGSGYLFAVIDDLKQRVSKVWGPIYNNLQSLHFNLQSRSFRLKGLR